MAHKIISHSFLLRFRSVNRDIFEAIRAGKKKVETRAATARYAGIKAWDVVTFLCGKDKFQRRVKRATIFRTIGAMLKKYTVRDINPECATAKELRGLYFSFPGYKEKIKKFGLIALELK
ncbi:MAG: hypothetical protein HYV25_02870 [Candidatus Harrisonbacteria bacterium]|nr:hypothetical protein [Candidatus Harrisonbacteria bacterium]